MGQGSLTQKYASDLYTKRPHVMHCEAGLSSFKTSSGILGSLGMFPSLIFFNASLPSIKSKGLTPDYSQDHLVDGEQSG